MNRGIKVFNGRSYETLEKIASLARRDLAPNTDVDEPLPGLDVFERLGSLHVSANGQRRRVAYHVGGDLGFDVEARTRYVAEEDRFEVALSEDTFRELEFGEGRVLFTMPHEIGHVVLHREELFQLATIPHHRAMMRGAATHDIFMDSEWQADGFASSFAMPADGLLRLEAAGCLDPTTVQRTFRTSARAAHVRLKNFEAKRESFIRGAARARLVLEAASQK